MLMLFDYRLVVCLFHFFSSGFAKVISECAGIKIAFI
jgi:hypothetical protein